MRTSALSICFVVSCFFYNTVFSQTPFYISPSTSLTIRSGETLYTDSLWLTPSADFTIGNNSVIRNQNTTNSGLSTYMNHVFKLGSLTNNFYGAIGIRYVDAKLNGLDESQLRLSVYDGTRWLYVLDNVKNPVDNTVTTQVNGVVMSELVLSNQLTILPLQWGAVQAQREGVSIRIKWNSLQANGVSHFNVEKSIDGIIWNTILLNIPAKNAAGRQDYQQVDPVFNTNKLLYRIRQTDLNGEVRLSQSVMVPAIKSSVQLTVYPNPAANLVTISGIDPSKFLRVSIVNSNGVTLKTSNAYQSSYDVNMLPAGKYAVEVMLISGEQRITQFIKQ